MKEVVARDGIVAIVIIRRVGGRHLRTIIVILTISMLTRKLVLKDEDNGDLRWGLAEGEP